MSKKGYEKPEPSGINLRVYDTLPPDKIYTVVAKYNLRVVSVMSLVIDSVVGLPADCAFQTDLDALRRDGLTLSEGTNWASDKEFENTSVSFYLQCITATIADNYGLNMFLGTVDKAKREYLKIFDMTELAGPVDYNGNPQDKVWLVGMKPTWKLPLRLAEYQDELDQVMESLEGPLWLQH